MAAFFTSGSTSSTSYIPVSLTFPSRHPRPFLDRGKRSLRLCSATNWTTTLIITLSALSRLNIYYSLRGCTISLRYLPLNYSHNPWTVHRLLQIIQPRCLHFFYANLWQSCTYIFLRGHLLQLPNDLPHAAGKPGWCHHGSGHRSVWPLAKFYLESIGNHYRQDHSLRL